MLFTNSWKSSRSTFDGESTEVWLRVTDMGKPTCRAPHLVLLGAPGREISSLLLDFPRGRGKHCYHSCATCDLPPEALAAGEASPHMP